MAIVNLRDMIIHAYENNYAVGAFDLVSLEFLEGVIDAAERCRAPVILSLAEPHFTHYDVELLLPAVEAAARRASVPVAIQFDHGASYDSIVQGINLGCNGVMLDATQEELPANIEMTRKITQMAHGCGVAVVGELGYVAGIEGEGGQQHPGEPMFTVPSEARAYVERTGIDFLAVSIGTVQGRQRGRAKLDFQRLKNVHEAVRVPLVIHGGSGLTDDQYRRLIAHNVAMINYYTGLSEIAFASERELLRGNRDGSYTAVNKGVRAAVAAEAERCLRLWGGAGRAAEILTQCREWRPVEHIIVYNVDGLDSDGVDAMMVNGRRILGQIPGVREVFAGEAVKVDGAYRYCWRVRFVSEAVIDSYRNHPDHVAFADHYFRPYADDRLSIDFLAVQTIPGQVAGPHPPLNTPVSRVQGSS